MLIIFWKKKMLLFVFFSLKVKILKAKKKNILPDLSTEVFVEIFMKYARFRFFNIFSVTFFWTNGLFIKNFVSFVQIFFKTFEQATQIPPLSVSMGLPLWIFKIKSFLFWYKYYRKHISSLQTSKSLKIPGYINSIFG